MLEQLQSVAKATKPRMYVKTLMTPVFPPPKSQTTGAKQLQRCAYMCASAADLPKSKQQQIGTFMGTKPAMDDPCSSHQPFGPPPICPKSAYDQGHAPEWAPAHATSPLDKHSAPSKTAEMVLMPNLG